MIELRKIVICNYMNLYDQLIEQCYKLLEDQSGRRLPIKKEGNGWDDAGQHNLVLRSEMAYELGGGNLPAISGLAFTSNCHLVNEDELWLYGPDLPELQQDTQYARITLIRIAEDCFSKEDNNKEEKVYNAMRKMEYTRYHMNPSGYMMRISTVNNREVVRVSKAALKNGLDISKVGSFFLKGYHQHPNVVAVKMIFITLNDFPYEKLNERIGKIEKVTQSLNHIFQNITMDCSICGFKEVCDEVEGLKELHFGEISS